MVEFDNDKVYVSKNKRYVGTKEMFHVANFPMTEDDIYLVTNVDKEFFNQNQESLIQVNDVKFNEEDKTATVDITAREFTFEDKLTFKHTIISLYIKKALGDALNIQRTYTFSLDRIPDTAFNTILAIELTVSTLGLNKVVDLIITEKDNEEALSELKRILSDTPIISLSVTSFNVVDGDTTPKNIETLELSVEELFTIMVDYYLLTKRVNRSLIMDRVNKVAQMDYETLSQAIGITTQDQLENSIVSIIEKMTN